jgi:hypothetical protein
LVENSWKKNYDYFVDLFVQIKELYEHMTLVDIINLSEMPYPIFNDVILKQIESNKRETKRLGNMSQQTNKRQFTK